MRVPSIVIADDESLVRMVLRNTVEAEGFDVAAECATVQDAIELTLAHRPDLVLIDWSLPDGDPVDAIRAASEVRPPIPVIVLGAEHDGRAPLRSLLAGAAGFLYKDAVLSGFGRTLRAVLEGEAGISRKLSGVVVDRLRGVTPGKLGTRPVRSPLSTREWEVFDLLCQQRSTDEVAAALSLSPETVRTHIKNILRKLGVSSRAEAVALAAELRKPVGSDASFAG